MTSTVCLSQVVKRGVVPINGRVRVASFTYGTGVRGCGLSSRLSLRNANQSPNLLYLCQLAEAGFLGDTSYCTSMRPVTVQDSVYPPEGANNAVQCIQSELAVLQGRLSRRNVTLL